MLSRPAKEDKGDIVLGIHVIVRGILTVKKGMIPHHNKNFGFKNLSTTAKCVITKVIKYNANPLRIELILILCF